MILLMLLAPACESHRPKSNNERIAAASAFTERYASSSLAYWDVRAHAAGPDCGVLLVESKIVLEDAMVEALHYGGGAYDVYKGGVQQFWHDRAFRGVAYRDGTGHVWTYGDVTTAEGQALTPCR
jgi:hypothetical protein